MRFTATERDELLEEHFDDWLKAYTTKERKLRYKVQILTVKFHNQRCECANKAVMNKLKAYYIMMGLY